LVLSLLLLLAGTMVACTPPSRVSAYHQHCLECALRRTADPTGVPQAVRYFGEGCRDGDARSCSVLGVMYERGRGVVADRDQALTLYGRACRGGNPEGCVNLGRLVEGRDAEGALVAYEVACAGHNAEGCRRRADAERAVIEAEVYGE
jgi:TPR repeat protein